MASTRTAKRETQEDWGLEVSNEGPQAVFFRGTVLDFAAPKYR